jgi:hypothetical protein
MHDAERVRTDRQVRPMLFQHAHREDEHRPLAIERVNLWPAELVEVANARLPLFAVQGESSYRAQNHQGGHGVFHDEPPIQHAHLVSCTREDASSAMQRIVHSIVGRVVEP